MSAKAVTPNPAQGPTVLVVDDSPTEVRILRGVLERSGARVLVAMDGEEAIDLASRDKPDLVLLDIILPKKNGFQVCRQLRTSAGTKDLRILLVSSKSLDSDKFWGLRQGADDYLVKPFSMEVLAEKVARLTGYRVGSNQVPFQAESPEVAR